MEKYPIIKSETAITEEIIKIIIKNNPELFSFIGDFGNDVIEEKKKTKKTIAKDKITIRQYCNYLNPVRPLFPAIISCGFRKGEIFIEI